MGKITIQPTQSFLPKYFFRETKTNSGNDRERDSDGIEKIGNEGKKE